MSKFGSKSERTKKCKCKNPLWSVFEFSISKLKDNYTITLQCYNCNSLWDTKSMNDDIFIKLNENQKSAYLSVLNNQLQKEIKNVENKNLKIKELESQIKKGNKAISKYETLIEKYAEMY